MELLLAFLGVAYKHRKESRPQCPTLLHSYSTEGLCAACTSSVLAASLHNQEILSKDPHPTIEAILVQVPQGSDGAAESREDLKAVQLGRVKHR